MQKLTKNHPVVKVTDALNKNGVIKCKSKKETKTIKLICGGYRINKKGKLRPTIYNNGSGTCTCDACGRSFRTAVYKQDEIKAIKDETIEFCDQGEYMAISVDAGEEAVRAFAEAKVAIANAAKAYNRVAAMAQKQERIHNKKHGKNNGRNNRDGESAFGSWGSR